MSWFIEARPKGGTPVRLEILPGKPVVIGRSDQADMKVAGEGYLSRKHVEVKLEGKRLAVKRLEGSSNPVLFRGAESAEFAMGVNDWFAIGETRFVLQGGEGMVPLETETQESPAVQHTMSEADLYTMGGRAERMQLLDLLELPEMLRSMKREDFFVHLAGMLRLATDARWAAVANENGEVIARDSIEDAPDGFRMSRSVIKAALRDAPRPTLCVWGGTAGFEATVQEGTDWAICAAMRVPGGTPFVLYAAGEGGEEAARRHEENSRFIGLVADMVARSLSVQRLESWQGRLEHYFSGPVISKILETSDPKGLEPRIAPATIMFFDIRGFSKRTEGQNERILSYLGELRRIMTAMTEEIFKEGGVVLQYLGDGIMACWNVPIEVPHHVDGAVRAAMRMEKRLGEMTDGWRCGIGLHTGNVVAGSIGSDLMFSYGVMGAVVNQSSRVEGITKHVETQILVTKEIADQLSPGVALTRRIGRFQPAGMHVALDLYEPLPADADREAIAIYGKGLEVFERGEWEEAYKVLDQLGHEDRPARFIKALAESYRRRPPKDWQGIIELIEK